MAGVLAALVAAGAQAPDQAPYAAPQATERVADGPRPVRLDNSLAKFAAGAQPGAPPNLTITNPFMDPARPLFAKAEAIECTADGGLVISGGAGPDQYGRAFATGFWRVAADGAVAALHSRPAGGGASARCDTPFASTGLQASDFSLAADGRVLLASSAAALAVAPTGLVTRLAGSPAACQGPGNASIEGDQDGASPSARFKDPGRLVEDSDGNVWVADQKGCALRRIAPDGEVTTVIPPSIACNPADAAPDRLLLRNLTWDPVNRELVSGGDLLASRPSHNLYTTIWRIKPTGEFRRVFFATKLGRNPARQNVDGINALAVDPKGRIHIVSLLMVFEQRGFDVLQLMRVDEQKGTLVPITGTRIPPGTYLPDHPLDGRAELAWFQGTRDLCFSPDGTAFVNDDRIIRRVDPSGPVSTWVF